MTSMRRVAAWIALLATLAAAQGGFARAGDVAALYETEAIVTGTGEANRRIGFEECFRDVLLKVSGDQRVLRDAKVEAALPDAGSFVASFRYRDRLEGIPVHDEQGTHDRPHDLYCSFDRARIDAFLGSLGRQPFLADRPPLLLLLAVRTATGKRFVLTRDGGDSPYMRDSLIAAARPLAMAVEVPLKADIAAAGSGAGATAAMAQQAGARLLTGDLAWSEADRGWLAEWKFEQAGTTWRWAVRGVSFDEAFRNAMKGVLQIVSGHGQPE